MIYVRLMPLALIEAGVDELGNTIKEPKRLDIIECKLTDFTKEDINIYGRDITKNSKKIIMKRHQFKDEIEKFIFAGKEFDFKVLKKGYRWVVIEVLAWR